MRDAAGIPTMIYRPSIIIGDSNTGEADRGMVVYGFVAALKAIKSFYEKPQNHKGHVNGILQTPFKIVSGESASLNLIPVNFVVDYIVGLAQDDENIGMSFHLTQPNAVSVRHLVDALSDCFGIEGIKLVESAEGLEGFEERLYDRLRIIQPYLCTPDPTFDRSNVRDSNMGSYEILPITTTLPFIAQRAVQMR